jgi:cytochrome c-type biogenesis protein CcmH/NrfG
MLLWIIFAVLTVGALIAVLWPFLVFGRGGTQDADDTAVYRDQLREIDSDLARGLIGEAEFATMPPDAVLVNTARGPIVDEQALLLGQRRLHVEVIEHTIACDPKDK